MNNIKFNDFIKEVNIRHDEYLSAINRVIESGWFILGKEVELFEGEFSKYLGTRNCIGVANGLEALQISLMALGIGEGDEVITTPLSAVATTLAIMAVKAAPVFVDVDERGLLDVKQIYKKINSKTKAILPVHLYGQSLDLDKFSNLCKKNNIKLIEDACQAHGSKYKNKFLGTIGDIGCFSFYPTKNLGAFGDGGAIVTDDDDLASKCRILRDYGQSSKYIHSFYGLNSRLDEIQASILGVKLKYLDVDNEKRRQNVLQYTKYLKDISIYKLFKNYPYEVNNFHQFVIRTPLRNELQIYLKQKNIPTLIHYPSTIPDQPMFKNIYKNLNIPNARLLCNEILSLPVSFTITDEEISYIINALKEFAEINRI